jgi:hypothetical protein
MLKAVTHTVLFSRRQPLESSQLDSGLGHQGDESRNKVHRLEDDVRGAIAVRRFEFVTHMAIAQLRQPLFRHRWPCDGVESVENSR